MGSACWKSSNAPPGSPNIPLARPAHSSVTPLVWTRRDRSVSARTSRNLDTLSHAAASRSPTSRTTSSTPAASPSRNTSNNSTSLGIGSHPPAVEVVGAPLLGLAQLVLVELFGHGRHQRCEQG